MSKKEEVKSEVVKREESDNEDPDAMGEEELEWWAQENITFATKGEKRWDTLKHNGVMFPPEYVPHGIPIVYAGKEFKMTVEEEEVATMYAVMKESDYYHNPTFCKNFFRSWRAILDKRDHPIRELGLCDFDKIWQWHVMEREKRNNRSREEKKKEKEEKDAEAEPFKFCLWDGRREQVANFRVEPPGLFRGRGMHPMAGCLKVRVQPEDITLNMDEVAAQNPPPPPPGHKWGSIISNNTVTWLAMWRDNILGNFKYVMLAPSSTIKGQSDYLKFEKARSLKQRIDSIRDSYQADFKSRDPYVAQRAVAMYFIDKLALRVGNEKGSDEADTVGCCSLRVEHLELKSDNIVRFDFLGKDSIRYQNEVPVLPEVHELLRRFMRGKRPSDDIFDQLTPGQLNEHLKSFMDGLSAKVFRTYNASICLDRWFKEKPVDPSASLADKLAYFNKANTEVAILCNHQKSVSKNFRSQLAQLTAKTGYTRKTIELLEEAKVTAKKKSYEAAAKEFLEAQDRIQRDWLDAYGTEEQKKEFEEMVAKRNAPKERKSSSGTKKSRSGSKSGTKKSSKKAKKSSSGAAKKKSSKKAAKAKPASAKKAKSTKKEESSDEDQTLAEMAEKPAGSKRGRGATDSKKSKKAKKETSDDEDVPLAALF